MQEIQFDFFRGMEAEQYTFYRIPKILFTSKCFQFLSSESKVLYGLLLDRMSLSMKNRWLDEEGRVYIIFKVEEIVELMNCGTQKAIKLLKELDGEGLIEKRRMGLGKPNVIYVKNFIIRQTENDVTEKVHTEEPAHTQNCENQNSGTMETKEERERESRNHENDDTGMADDICRTIPESERPNGEEQKPGMGNMGKPEGLVSKIRDSGNHKSRMMNITIPEIPSSQIQNCENQNSGTMKTTILEIPISQIQNCENQNSGTMKTTILEFPKSKSNNTDINNTKINEKEYSDTDLKETESEREEGIYPNLITSYPSIPDGRKDVMDRIEACRDVIRENISYECFRDGRCHRIGEIDELVELMTEVMLMPDAAVLRIAGTEKPAAIVKSRFMKLNQGHMEYIMSCLASNTTKVGNIRAYLLTVLYNAALTVNNYYMAEVNYDLR